VVPPLIGVFVLAFLVLGDLRAFVATASGWLPALSSA